MNSMTSIEPSGCFFKLPKSGLLTLWPKGQFGRFGRLADDHLRTLRASIDYDFIDNVLGPKLAAITAIRLEVRQGLGVFGATTSSDPNRSRLNADGTYTAFAAEIQRYQSLGVPGFTLLAAATGQISSDPLLSSAEFGFGGSAYG